MYIMYLICCIVTLVTVFKCSYFLIYQFYLLLGVAGSGDFLHSRYMCVVSGCKAHHLDVFASLGCIRITWMYSLLCYILVSRCPNSWMFIFFSPSFIIIVILGILFVW